VIWGTSVSASEFKEKFKRFIETFKVIDAAEDEIDNDFDLDEPLYIQKLHEVCFHARSFESKVNSNSNEDSLIMSFVLCNPDSCAGRSISESEL